MRRPEVRVIGPGVMGRGIEKCGAAAEEIDRCAREADAARKLSELRACLKQPE